MVRTEGFQPSTSEFVARRSVLSYARMAADHGFQPWTPCHHSATNFQDWLLEPDICHKAEVENRTQFPILPRLYITIMLHQPNLRLGARTTRFELAATP